jgi:hypothetical protein
VPALSTWNCLQLEDHSVFFMAVENSEGRTLSCDGAIVFPWVDERPPVRLVGLEHNLTFLPGSVRLSAAEITLLDVDGNRHEYQCKGSGLVLSCQGQGDFDGFADGRGWGVYRGEYHEEYEVWDFTEADRIINLTDNGFTPQAWYLENITEISDGRSHGYGLQEVGVFGPYARYGFTGKPGS